MISRRRMLRGMGAMIALPQLEIMAAVSGKGSTEKKPPLRYLSVFQPNGVYPKAWDVKGTGANYQLSPILAPLKELRDEFMVVSGLNNTVGGDHVQMTSAFLTGVNIKNGKAAMSIDQQIAKKIGGNTAYESLVLGTEPPRQGSVRGNAISIASTVSWSSPTTRISPEINPRVAFDRLFRNKTGAEAVRRAELRQSVVDLVLEDAKAIRRKASSLDQQKLDEYLESVRSVEVQLERVTDPKQADWTPHSVPSERDLAAPPMGIPRERDVHLRLMMDLMVLALWTDTTRVCTLMTAHGFSRQNFSFIDGVTGDHHGISHHKERQEAVTQYTHVSRWYVEQFGYLINRLKSIDEGGSNLLDNSIVFYGSAMKDGNGHKKNDLPVLLAGGGQGQLKQGRHVKLPAQPLSNLHYTIGQKFGIQSPDFNGTQSKTIQALG
ncbi:DUF1552 domain-containing protein [Verrucomicrobiaceae bacterium 5K15]|uniref:DUF1552 domain-containing protein n=1 Tax=Oceaniferula flava TaxID=2800421 RepID=A0AAE2SDZ3_9BACT|nr:DUF1552 domain-containing protein [Oceaniferula flavus]MBK1856445.1 DUF1552 domain-containing protein [Oceaniferula flavus]MBM1137752.1 DUF1552 domain-containing protein [Oceaniferula flavus]